MTATPGSRPKCQAAKQQIKEEMAEVRFTKLSAENVENAGHFHEEDCNSPQDLRGAYLIFTFVLGMMPSHFFFSQEIVLDPGEGDVYGEHVLNDPVVCWDDP